MALGSNVHWEVQTGGSDNNGGGFDAVSGSPGTSRVYPTSSPISWLASSGTYTNDLAATNVTNSVLTSASYTFAAADVGNIINITAGTNFVAGRYRIQSVGTGAATLDRNCCTGGDGSSGSGYLGGALATPGMLNSLFNADYQKAFIKSGTYTMTTATAGSGGPVNLPNNFYSLYVEGYGSTRGDLGTKPSIEWDAALTLGSPTPLIGWSAVSSSAFVPSVVNIKVDGKNDSNVNGFMATNGGRALWCEVINCGQTNGRVGFSGFALVAFCYALDCGVGFAANNMAYGCEARSCSDDGFQIPFFSSCVKCLSVDSGNEGFAATSRGAVAIDCTAYNSGGDGFELGVGGINNTAINCVTDTAGAYAYNTAVDSWVIQCASRTNPSGFVNATPQHETPDSGSRLIPSGDPFENSASDDYRPDSTSGEGAILRGSGEGVPSQTNNTDIGAVQHTDPAESAGGGGGPIFGGMVVR